MKWRLVRMHRAKGRYFKLERGRAADRVSITLGYLSDQDAERALRHIQDEQDSDRIARVFWLKEHDRQMLLEFLVDDPEAERQFGPRAPDFGGLSLRRYLDEVYGPRRALERPKSWKSEERLWKRILEDIGAVKVRDIDVFTVRRHLEGARCQRGSRVGEPLSGASKRLRRQALKGLMAHAFWERHVDQQIDWSLLHGVAGTKPVLEKQDPLNLEELRRLVEVSAPGHAAMWATGVGLGLRPGELIALDWADVLLSRGQVHVRGTKTDEADGVVPLTPVAEEALRRHWVRCGRPSSGVVFPQRNGKPYADSGGYRKALRTAARKAEIGRPVTPYLLRHSFATIAWELGVDKDVARRIMRHTDTTMLDEVYTRPNPEALRRKAAQFAWPQS